MVYQHGDEERSCDALERELEMIEEDILDILPETEKADRNTQLGIAGIFLTVPFFFMDISKSEQIEVNALVKRYNHLVEIADNQNCSLNRAQIPDARKSYRS